VVQVRELRALLRGRSAGLAARNRLAYSFVPNIVRLPREVSKLPDRDGAFVQG
jgi:hypothetical protein